MGSREETYKVSHFPAGTAVSIQEVRVFFSCRDV